MKPKSFEWHLATLFLEDRQLAKSSRTFFVGEFTGWFLLQWHELPQLTVCVCVCVFVIRWNLTKKFSWQKWRVLALFHVPTHTCQRKPPSLLDVTMTTSCGAKTALLNACKPTHTFVWTRWNDTCLLMHKTHTTHEKEKEDIPTCFRFVTIGHCIYQILVEHLVAIE